MRIPPVKKFWILNVGRETGQGVDKTEISRAHEGEGVVYMPKKPDNRSEAVKTITRTKLYRELEHDLRQQLEANGVYGKFFDDMISDYMAMYVTKTLLVEDIQKRGTIVKYNNGGGQEGYKKNESVEMFNKTNAQMLKLLAELGLKANAMLGGGDIDDEL